jgi:hypothetical protein
MQVPRPDVRMPERTWVLFPQAAGDLGQRCRTMRYEYLYIRRLILTDKTRFRFLVIVTVMPVSNAVDDNAIDFNSPESCFIHKGHSAKRNKVIQRRAYCLALSAVSMIMRTTAEDDLRSIIADFVKTAEHFIIGDVDTRRTEQVPGDQQQVDPRKLVMNVTEHFYSRARCHPAK